MGFAWFAYTIVIVVIAIAACSTSVMMWALTQHRRWLVSAAGFLVYVIEQAIIFYGEYAGSKPYLDEYFNHGLSFPPLSIGLSVALLSLWWAWVSMRVYAPVTRRRVIGFSLVVAVALVLVAPVGSVSGATRNMLYWGLRDCLFIGGILYGAWWYRNRASKNERADIARSDHQARVLLVLCCCVLMEDITFIELVHPEAIGNDLLYQFFWHLTERNISENVTMVYCAYSLVRHAREVLAVFSNHPAEVRGEANGSAISSDIDVRLPRFCDALGMSRREQDVLRLVLDEKSTQEIASSLFISPGTVKAHLHRIYTKAGVSSRKDLVTAFWRFQ